MVFHMYVQKSLLNEKSALGMEPSETNPIDGNDTTILLHDRDHEL